MWGSPRGSSAVVAVGPVPRVIVIGGGFGGLALVRQLARARRRGRLATRVTLIDRRNHHTFQPLLYQVATAGLQTQDVGISLRAILRHQDVEIRLGEGKAESELTNPVVVAKRDAAREWVNTVNAASEVQDRWGYLLAGEKVTAAAGTWAELRAASQTHGPA